MPSGSWNSACVRPYTAIAKPPIAGVLPGSSLAYSANTGNTKNMPSIRSAYTPDSDALARHSAGNRAVRGARDIVFERIRLGKNAADYTRSLMPSGAFRAGQKPDIFQVACFAAAAT